MPKEIGVTASSAKGALCGKVELLSADTNPDTLIPDQVIWETLLRSKFKENYSAFLKIGHGSISEDKKNMDYKNTSNHVNVSKKELEKLKSDLNELLKENKNLKSDLNELRKANEKLKNNKLQQINSMDNTNKLEESTKENKYLTTRLNKALEDITIKKDIIYTLSTEKDELFEDRTRLKKLLIRRGEEADKRDSEFDETHDEMLKYYTKYNKKCVDFKKLENDYNDLKCEHDLNLHIQQTQNRYFASHSHTQREIDIIDTIISKTAELKTMITEK